MRCSAPSKRPHKAPQSSSQRARQPHGGSQGGLGIHTKADKEGDRPLMQGS